MSCWKWFLEAMNGNKATNWMLAVGFLLTIATNFGFGYWAEVRSDRREAIVEIRSASSDFQILAFNFVSAISDENQDASVARDALARQLIIFNDLLDDPRVRFEPASSNSAQALQEALVELQNEVLTAENPEALGDFWIAVRNVLVSRNQFLHDLGVRGSGTVEL